MSETPNILQIIKEGLKRDGYDGLFNEAYECACINDDLAPYGNFENGCKAGCKFECNSECGHEDWHITTTKHNE